MTSHSLVCLFFATSLRGQAMQLDLLRLREAQHLVETLPVIIAAKKAGECPEISPSYFESNSIAFQVRRGCGAERGQLISNYYVNRTTGEVGAWQDYPKPLADAVGRVLASQLVTRAWLRILTPAEARCLAREAAAALPDLSGEPAEISLEPFGRPDKLSSTVQFIASLSLKSQPITMGTVLTVNLRSGTVRDDHTGVSLVSKSLGELMEKVYTLRSPIGLSGVEAAQVARSVPRVAASLGPGCRVVVGGPFYSRQVSLGVSCARGYIGESTVLIDLETGSVTDDLESRGSLDTPESVSLAKRLISEAQERRLKLQEHISGYCSR